LLFDLIGAQSQFGALHRDEATSACRNRTETNWQDANADDLRQARELGLLICCGEQAIETFIAHCDAAARDLRMPHDDAVIVFSTVLRIKRTLDGDEIDKIISDLQAAKALAIERHRRVDWRKRELSATSFVADYGH
jgi:hypothetical protein